MQTNATALFVMDMQMGIVPRLPDGGKGVISKIAEAIKAAREMNILLIFVRVGFQKGLPEVSARNKTFFAAKAQLTAGHNLAAFMQFHPALGVREDDIVINKKRVSAFCGNELDVILRAQNITQLVLAGVSTSGVVLSTIREAADKDYALTVLGDGCADADEEVHRFLLSRVFPKQANVMTVEKWMTSIT